MQELAGKTAVITGGAEGIGFGIAQALGKHGMNIVLADIDTKQLQRAEDILKQQAVAVLTVTMDVSDINQWQQTAEQTIDRFGRIHMLVNNAGVSGTPGPVEQADDKDWRWVLDVNLMAIIYGGQTIIPLIKAHGEGGWVINTASIAGMLGVPFASAYTASKMAVVAMSESWQVELKPHNIQVSVLCPAFVKTRINSSYRNKPSQYQDATTPPSAETVAIAQHIQTVVDKGLAPELVGERVVEALQAKELYIFTHPNYRAVVQKRFQAIDAAFERAAASSLLADIVDQDVDRFM